MEDEPTTSALAQFPMMWLRCLLRWSDMMRYSLLLVSSVLHPEGLGSFNESQRTDGTNLELGAVSRLDSGRCSGQTRRGNRSQLRRDNVDSKVVSQVKGVTDGVVGRDSVSKVL